MKGLARLIDRLEAATDDAVRVQVLARHLRSLADADRVWVLALVTGHAPRRAVTGAQLRAWASEAADLPAWLVDDSLAVAGDLAETLAHLLPRPADDDGPAPGLAETMARLRDIAALDPGARKAGVLRLWTVLPPEARAVANRLLTGSFRGMVTPGLAARALAEVTGGDAAAMAQRLAAPWDPAATRMADLTPEPDGALRPYPFAPARPLDAAPETLGPAGDWAAAWHFGGLRVQAIRRGGGWQLWAPEGEPVTARFPDLDLLARLVPEATVISGEIMLSDPTSGQPLPAALAARMARKTLSARHLADAPAVLVAHDLLDLAGDALGLMPFATRRDRLDMLCARLPSGAPIRPAPAVMDEGWADRARALLRGRALGARSMWLTRRAAPFAATEVMDWSPPPMSIAAVLIHAEVGQGPGPLAAFTFAVRDGVALVPVAKASDGLPHEERAELSAWVRANTTDRFGPVRQVPPVQVFDIGFSAATAAPRRKSGLMLEAPRILRWHRDRAADDIDTLDTLRALSRM